MPRKATTKTDLDLQSPLQMQPQSKRKRTTTTKRSSNKNKNKSLQQPREPFLILSNGNTSTSTSCSLTKEEAMISPYIKTLLKGNGLNPSLPPLVLQNASNQNISDIAEFLSLQANEDKKKLIIRYPIRSQNCNDSILNPSWAGDFTNYLIKKISFLDLSSLAHCANLLLLSSLEQMALIAVATKLKGKSIQQMSQIIDEKKDEKKVSKISCHE